jgi:hypothetical protein
MPSAIGKSKRPESLGKSAGAKLTVILLLEGKSKPEFCKADRTRSLASFTSVSAKPTKVKLGKPLAKCTSTVTDGASSPKTARLCTIANPVMIFSLFWCIDYSKQIKHEYRLMNL